MRGPGSLNHNRRSFTAENVDPERSSLNVVYRDEPIQKVYHELFDEAVNRYNAKQKRKDPVSPTTMSTCGQASRKSFSMS